MGSSGIISSISIPSGVHGTISVLLSSPYFSATSLSSSTTISILMFLFPRISLSLVIRVSRVASSSSSVFLSSAVSLPRRISMIAWVCFSEKLKTSMSFAFASLWLEAAFIIRITSSMLSWALINPLRMCALASAFLYSN